MGSATNTEATSFGTLLTTFRHRRHFTQAHLAERIGVHRHAIGRWEQGDFLPRQKGMVLELAKHLYLDDQETRQLLEASLTAPVPYWLVPLPRNPLFTGRTELLERLHTLLHAESIGARSQSVALQGLGGVGKTQMAVEYAYRHALEYSSVFWIGAETLESCLFSLAQMAEVIQVLPRGDLDLQRILAAVQHWLASHSRWLLIWDNVEDLDLLDRLLPPNRPGAILLTTRCQTLGTLAQGINLAPMEQEEGRLFLLRRAKMLGPAATGEDARQFAVQRPAQHQAAALVVRALGGLPLALDQAGAYLEATRCGLPVYLELFLTQRAALLQQRGEGVRTHPASVSATFTLALAATSQRHPAVWDLLRVCALLQSEAIPEELFRQGAAQLGAPLEMACRDALEWNQVVASACAYSLLRRQPEEQTLSLHRLVQAVLVETMTEMERAEWSRRAIGALESTFPDVQYANWKQCARLLPHALLCLHQGEAASDPLVCASLAYKVAQYLRARGQYAQAEPLYQQALHVREQVLGADHPEMASPLNALAALYWEQGKYAQAEPLFLRALHLWEDALGPDHPEVARVLTNLANIYGSQGKDAQAELLFQRALHIRTQAWGPMHPTLARTLIGLATLYLQRKQYEQAELLFQQARSIWTQTLEPEHPDLLYALTGLGILWSEQGQNEQAESSFQQALCIAEQALGPEHPDVAYVLANQADLSTRQGQYEQAESLFQRALSIWTQTLGPEHTHVASLLSHQAGLATWQGRTEQAETWYQQALQIQERALGAAHPETAQTLHDLARFQQQRGKVGEALALAERALSIRSQSLGEAHPETVATRTLYARLVGEHQEDTSDAWHAEQIPDLLSSGGHPDESAGRMAAAGTPGDQSAYPQPVPAVTLLPASGPVAADTDSRLQMDARTRSETPDHLPAHTMQIAVRGATEQVAYTRTVRMRQVTFTCTICGHTITEWHYPSGQMKYCSEACRAVGVAQRHKERVAKQREKRQIERAARLQGLPQAIPSCDPNV